eukprot:Gregarina_sp_Pseudo_9__1490@NODE_1_length_8127_cov_32_238872_g0_i0_p7_GENE_NODE_1_length_8127_cov_32_238872_g0_i0NODE_1_length_8127_cov_32_238872_g0_i0_p7_ORF_typecomplete_len143_score11_32Strep_pep/PF14404_6/0_25_NODE_1_length_8127_cov_32_238872_g0_i033103738
MGLCLLSGETLPPEEGSNCCFWLLRRTLDLSERQKDKLEITASFTAAREPLRSSDVCVSVVRRSELPPTAFAVTGSKVESAARPVGRTRRRLAVRSGETAARSGETAARSGETAASAGSKTWLEGCGSSGAGERVTREGTMA